MVAFSPSSFAAVHSPIYWPARKLSVANVMSTASAGSGGVSSAITNRPASRAFSIASTTAGPFGVIRMPFSPCEMAFSMAWIWVSSSPSSLPAASVRLDAVLLGGLLGALLHGDEERVGVGLDDERDADLGRVPRRRSRTRRPRARAWMPARQPRPAAKRRRWADGVTMIPSHNADRLTSLSHSVLPHTQPRQG